MNNHVWKPVETFEVWQERWCENCRGPRSIELAYGLLGRLPALAVMPRVPESELRRDYHLENERDVAQAKTYFTGLYQVMDIATRISEPQLAATAKRAVYMLMKQIAPFLKVGRLPTIRVGKGFSVFDLEPWGWEGYRQLPQRLLTYFVHPRSYAGGMNLYEEIFAMWANILPHYEESRRQPGKFKLVYITEYHDWPNCQEEPWRRWFLRALVLNPKLSKHSRPNCLPDLVPDYFRTLVNARNHSIGAVPERHWPKFTADHATAIAREVCELGIELKMPYEDILPPEPVTKPVVEY